MLCRERVEVEYAPLFDKYGFGITSYSPAAGGALSGRFNCGRIPEGSKYESAWWLQDEYRETLAWREESGARMLQGLKAIAEEIGCSQNQLALAWVLCNRDVSTTLFGARNIGQIRDNVEALGVVKKLTPGILQRIEELLVNRPTPPMDFREFRLREPRR